MSAIAGFGHHFSFVLVIFILLVIILSTGFII
jgi:hypothetical protein